MINNKKVGKYYAFMGFYAKTISKDQQTLIFYAVLIIAYVSD